MQLHSKMTNQRVVLLIVGIWAVAIVMGLVPTWAGNCLCDLENCSSMAPMYSRSYMVFMGRSQPAHLLHHGGGVHAHLHLRAAQEPPHVAAHHPRCATGRPSSTL
ncbi:hypothetical protein SKAU_G00117480 [Synaphobranchus kaupii]|uniref:Uncharacterized protein n=1 Tax=Synaphobranchus kaupii TaxID=118154 RepID=A0A9Q1FN10_SYNKA|nr:hypothetical protein SKAU_G00117480 [Synaphobranchus kaupii]